MEGNIQMKSEVFFLKYAFPCSFIILQRGEITQEEFDQLEKAAINEDILPRKKLEKIFFRAFNRIKPIAEELKRDIWDLSVLEEYFLKRHSKLAEEGFEMSKNIPRTLKELCKIHVAKVVGKKENLLVTRYGDNTRVVMSAMVPEAKVGDKVTLHYGYAVEIVS